MRRDAGIPFDRPCDVYGLIAATGLELQFIAVPSLEGMYLAEKDVTRVCVSALRPPGRQRFTAAHELGHAVLRHGSRIDEIEELRMAGAPHEPDEQLADLFAASLLMPAGAVQAGFRLRNLHISDPGPPDVYRVATWLGVGYSTLLTHLRYGLKLLSPPRHAQLSKTHPKDIKTQLAHEQTTCEVLELDVLWRNMHVDIQLGHFVHGLAQATDAFAETGTGVYRAVRVGQTRASLFCGGSVTLRVCRRNYIGFYEHRYMPEEA